MTIASSFTSVLRRALLTHFSRIQRKKPVTRYRPCVETLEEKVLLSNYFWNAPAQFAFVSRAQNWDDGAGVPYTQPPSAWDTLIFNGRSAMDCIFDADAQDIYAAIQVGANYLGSLNLRENLSFYGVDVDAQGVITPNVESSLNRAHIEGDLRGIGQQQAARAMTFDGSPLTMVNVNLNTGLQLINAAGNVTTVQPADVPGNNIWDDSQFINNGTLIWKDQAVVSMAATQLVNNGTLNLEGAATFNSAVFPNANNPPSSFTNGGTMNVGGDVQIAPAFLNRGNLVIGGNLTLSSNSYPVQQADAALTRLAGGTLTVSSFWYIVNRGTLAGFGTIEGGISADAATIIPGVRPRIDVPLGDPVGPPLTINGNVTMTARTTLLINTDPMGGMACLIANPTPANPTYGQVRMGNAGEANARIVVAVAGGFTPMLGSTYEFLTCQSLFNRVRTAASIEPGWPDVVGGRVVQMHSIRRATDQLPRRERLVFKVVQGAVAQVGLNLSDNPCVVGNAVTFTAAVAVPDPSDDSSPDTADYYDGPEDPTGTVTFYDGATALQTATLATGSATISTSTLAVGVHAITAVYSGDSVFDRQSSDPSDLLVLSKTPTITWGNPSDITYGVALNESQLNASAKYGETSVPGTFFYTPASGTVLYAGNNQTLSVTFMPSDWAQYVTVSKTVSINVHPAVLTVSADNKSKAFGAGNPTLTATITGFVNGDGGFVVSGAPSLSTTAASDSPIGAYPITAGLGSLSASNYSFAFADGTLTVNPVTVTFTNPGNRVDLVGALINVPLYASASNGLALTFTATGLPPGLTIGTDQNGNGLVSGTIDSSALLDTPYTVTITATDPFSGASTTITFSWTVTAIGGGSGGI